MMHCKKKSTIRKATTAASKEALDLGLIRCMAPAIKTYTPQQNVSVIRMERMPLFSRAGTLDGVQKHDL
jgi:hypothetical protein